MTLRRFPPLPVPALGRASGRGPVTLMLMLGLAAIILGILGMHVLSVPHQIQPAAAPHVAMAPDTGSAAATSTHHADSQDPGLAPALSAWAGVDHMAAGVCTGPCGGEHHLMAAMCVLLVIILTTLWFIPKRWFLKARHGLRAPPTVPFPAIRLPWTPSLIELSISRT